MISISVRQMVEFTLRSGDIDTAYMSANRALEGTRVHQHVQRERKAQAKGEGAVYEREVPVDLTCEYKDITFALKGRADGIRVNTDGSVIIEEIKSTLSPVSNLTDDPEHWHWAQAKCYGYMYLANKETKEENLAGLSVALTYGQVETNETRIFTRAFTFEELTEFFFGLLERYYEFARMDIERQTLRDSSGKALQFPFGAYRPGQRELAVSVYATVKQKKKLFAQAPTGIGKTISTLFPAVKSMAEGIGAKCFYLTAKTVARKNAEDAMGLMKERGLVMRSVTITAKDKICFLSTRDCSPDVCTYAKGHFDRVNEAILEIISNEQLITRDVIAAYAEKHWVCPAELQLDVSLFCDVIICDYNHAYDPKAKLQRFFEKGGDFILLNDEAHNLIDRARDMFSAGLYKSDFDRLRKELGKEHPLYKGLGAVSKELRKCWKEAEGQAPANKAVREPFCREQHPADLPALLFVFAGACDEFLQAHRDGTPMLEEIMDIYFKALDYLRVAEMYDERYSFFCEPQNGYIRLYCLDPSYLLSLAQKKARACVFFSATLTPLTYFRSLLGGVAEDYTLRLASPFPRANLNLVVDCSISTRYKDRGLSYRAIADRLFTLVSGRLGNYIVFFPSYAYLSEVYTLFNDAHPNVRVMIQESEMPDERREEYLTAFSDKPGETMLAFAVLGGAFSEGIDLKGERLIGAAVIGVGLPLICAERNVLQTFFGREGFDFAYRYPGMNKVLQAAGRVIRGSEDRGVVYLIDDRFGENAYRELFPPEWAGYERVQNEAQLRKSLGRFWGER
jgi:DNA excision repair protein ERCC-2